MLVLRLRSSGVKISSLFNIHLNLQVKLWITHNEPWVISVHGYETGEKAPGRTGLGYEASHQLIRAHGMAYKLYNDKYRATQNGEFSLLS